MRRTTLISSIVALVVLSGGVALAAPSNDSFTGATEITVLGFDDVVDTAEATTESGEPQPCGNVGATVWYRYAPAVSQTVFADTIGSDFDTVLAVYRGTGPFDLRNLDCSNNDVSTQSRLIFDVVGGQTYFLQAGGSYGETGTLHLHVATTGTLSGSVADVEGAPVSEICVTVYDLTRGILQSDVTDGDGEYRIGGVPAGQVKVRFKDCGSYGPAYHGTPGKYSTQYYADQKTFATATPVTVASSAETTGVDAILKERARPNLAVTSLVLEDVAVQGPGGQPLPSGGYNRRIHVEAKNTGTITPRFAFLTVEICPRTIGSCKHLPDARVSIAPGATVKRTFNWNGADMGGDVTVSALANPNEDADWNDNVVAVDHYVHAGGTGFGVGQVCNPLGSVVVRELCVHV